MERQPKDEDTCFAKSVPETPVGTHDAGNPQVCNDSVAQTSPTEPTRERVRVIGCDRASTGRQSGDEKAQRTQNRHAYDAFVRAHGFQNVGYYAFTESGGLVAGKRHQTIDRLVRKGKIDAVWFPDEKRASRKTSGGLEWFEALLLAGIRLFIGARELTNDAASHVATGVTLTLAQAERMTLQQRGLAQHHYVAQGQWLTGKPPFGYDKDADSRKLSVNPAEANLVRLAFDAASGQPFSTVKVHEAVRATGLPRGAVRKLLTNPIYRGVIRWGKRLHPYDAYRLVDDQVWHAAQIPKKQRQGKTAKAVENLALEIGNATLVTEFLRRVPISCVKCPPVDDCMPCVDLRGRERLNGGRPPAEDPHRIRLLGTTVIGAYEIPKVGCRHGHETQLVGTREVAAARIVIRCRHCDNRDSRRFWVRRPKGSARYDLQCKICKVSQRNWSFHPFKGRPAQDSPPVERSLKSFQGGDDE